MKSHGRKHLVDGDALRLERWSPTHGLWAVRAERSRLCSIVTGERYKTVKQRDLSGLAPALWHRFVRHPFAPPETPNEGRCTAAVDHRAGPRESDRAANRRGEPATRSRRLCARGGAVQPAPEGPDENANPPERCRHPQGVATQETYDGTSYAADLTAGQARCSIDRPQAIGVLALPTAPIRSAPTA